MSHSISALVVSSVPGFPVPGVVIAASRAGFVGSLAMEYVPHEEALSATREVVASGVDFGLSVDELNEQSLKLIAVGQSGGLRQIILSRFGSGHLDESLRRLKERGLQVFVTVRSASEAAEAESAGANGLIVKGTEAGGLVGAETTFILLQRVLRETRLPVYAQGGIGLHTAGACIAGGAAGVVMDWQFALADESTLPAGLQRKLSRMDGGETAYLGQDCPYCYRAYNRPGETSFAELKAREEQMGLCSESPAESLREWREAVEKEVAEKRLLLVSQDACFASRLAEEYRSVRGIGNAILRAARRNRASAAQLDPLREHGPLAQSHGTTYPVVQGPMTRVSDRAEFAYQVAKGGGLPFLALALLRGSKVGELLDNTADMLKDLPWGVGILGFVPKELREEQLAEVVKRKPRFALIAGGRPDQAKQLEELGIATYLHVPSPELLRLFLESGSKRFVFEGRECGGHVGPRSSFVLWESAVLVLREHLAKNQKNKPGDYHILFAGGIHDALSAAMVTVLAAPLTEMGARIGVLMGTSYLFTEEAVRSGAIVEGFQQEAVKCTGTALVESGVGHATRCALTPFVDAFQAEKRRLLSAALSKDDLRDALERMNLGRLRVASKGITRGTGEDSPRYIAVDPETQRQEGMYMIGQVAALRDRVCTIEGLHREVSQAARLLGKPAVAVESLAEYTERESRRRPSDIAIVGMSCRFARADNVSEYWHNILNRVCALSEVPKERWDPNVYFDEDRRARDRVYSRWGGFLNDVPFDPLRYGMPPNSVASVDPLQLIMLEMVAAALHDAGYDKRPFDRENTSVIVGVGGGSGDLGLQYGFRAMAPHFVTEAGGSRQDAERLIENLDHWLPEWTEDSFAGLLLNVVAGRVANRFDFGGTNLSVDAACATSLAAVRMGCSELESGASNVSIVAGADLMQNPFTYLCFSKTQALSPTGRCRTFDESADGIVISEGFGVAILKRLEDAERDGDRIYAVLKSVGASSDGSEKGLTAPRPDGQIRALTRAYEKARVNPKTVGLLEAHGTGTVVGDQTEVKSMSTYFGGAGAALQSCALGSVKTNIGHTKCTAGIAGLLKVTKALYHQTLPPMIGVETPNTKANFPQTPFYLNVDTRPWLRSPDGAPRRAGVSAFGFGGTNFHAVVEEYDGQEEVQPALADWPVELFLFRAASGDELTGRLRKIQTELDAGAAPRLADLAGAVYWRFGRDEGAYCLALVAESLDDLKKKLARAISEIEKKTLSLHDPRGIYYSSEPRFAGGKIAFLFPGQGSQRVDMLRDLAVNFFEVRSAIEEAEAALGDTLGRRLSSFLYPSSAFTPEEKAAHEEALKQTDVAQPALGAADIGVYRLLSACGVIPDMAAGHSYGELAALCAAGVWSVDDLARLSSARGRLIIESAHPEPGVMAAVSAGEPEVLAALEPIQGVSIANLNSPVQTVITGTEAGVGEAIRALEAKKVACKRIPVACAFHSSLVAGASGRFRELLDSVETSSPRFPVYSNTTALPHSHEPSEIREILAKHLAMPVRFADEVTRMYDDGARIFVEAGPGKVLTGLAGRNLGEQPHLAVSTDQPGRHGLVQLAHLFAQLSAAGVRPHLWRLFEGRVTTHLDLDRLAEQTLPKPLPATTWVVRAGRAFPAHKSADEKHRYVQVITDPAETTLAVAPAVSRKVPPQANGRQLSPRAAPASATTPANTAPAPSVPPHSSNSADLPAGAHASRPLASSAAPAEIESVMRNYQQTMSKFLDTQKAIMLDFLRAGAGQTAPAAELGESRAAEPEHFVPAPPSAATATPPEPPSTAAYTPDEAEPAAAEPAEAAPAVVAEMTPAAPGISLESLLGKLVQLVSDRTGYPTGMLDPDLDLEADLGVDSIKRVEILGALQSDTSMSSAGGTSAIEELAKLKTLRAIAEWIYERSGAGESTAAPAADSVSAGIEQKPEEQPALNEKSLLGKLVALVSDRTGYPSEMLDPDLDLEADLGVDSIKRVEILGALQNESVIASSGGAVDIEELAKLKTIRAIAQWILDKSTTIEVVEEPAAESESQAAQARALPAAAAPARKEVSRLTARWRPIPALTQGPSLSLTGAVLITDDGGGVAAKLAEVLGGAGVNSQILKIPAAQALDAAWAAARREELQAASITAVVHLASLAAHPPEDTSAWPDRIEAELKALLLLVQNHEEELRKNPTGTVLAATMMDGAFGFGGGDAAFWPGSGAVCGFVKSLAREWPEVSCKTVDFSPHSSPEFIAQALVRELAARDKRPEIGYRSTERGAIYTEKHALPDEANGLELDRDSVILVTGGARGITAGIVRQLADRFRCRFALAGRSPLPEGQESPDTAGLTEPAKIKAVLIESLHRNGKKPAPAAVERSFRKLMREREIRENMNALSAAATSIEYHSVDVCDAAAAGSLIDSIYSRYGRLDGVIHGAGVIEDKLVRDKTTESLERVIWPKILGALALTSALRQRELLFLSFFSSVAGRYGNRGQADYAAANEFLNKLAIWLNARWPGRVFSINWGPWKSEGGMVSAELAEQFARAGVEMIDPADGQEIFVRELLRGGSEESDVIWGGPIQEQSRLEPEEELEHLPATAAVPPHPMLSPLAGATVVANGTLEIMRRTAPEMDIYLRHHLLDGKPVMPTAMILELCAEALAAGWPLKKLTRIRDLRLMRGISFGDVRERLLRLQGTPSPNGNGHFSIDLHVESVTERPELHYRARAELESLDAAHPNGGRLNLANTRQFPMSMEAAYDQWLFHGPLFAGISHVEALGENGIIGTLGRSDPRDYFSYAPQGAWLVDPMMIDSGFQLVLLWARAYLDMTPLPSRMGSYQRFDVPLEDANLLCEVEVRNEPGSPLVQADLRFFDSRNRLVTLLEDMEFTCSRELNRLSQGRKTELLEGVNERS